MESVPQWIIRHQLMSDISIDDFGDFWLNTQLFDGFKHQQRIAFDWVVASFKFINDSITCDDVIGQTVLIPPLTSPLSPSYHFRLGSNFVVKARNSSFDVDLRNHYAISILLWQTVLAK